MEVETINVTVEAKTEEKRKFGGSQGGGRPSKMTDAVVAKLLEGFKNDFTDEEACIYAGIDRATYFRYKKKNKAFATEVEAAKRFLFLVAKKNITQALAGKKDLNTGEWISKPSVDDTWKFLSKRQKEIYSDRVETTGANGKELEGTKITINSFTKNQIVNMDTADLLGAMDQLALGE